MRPDELRATGTLTGTVLDEVTDVARDMHRAIAGRLFGLVGRPGRPVQRLHDAIATVAYTSTKLGARHLPSLTGLVAGAAHRPSADSVHDTARGRFALGAISGVVGDRMVDESSALAPPLRLRLADGPLRREPDNLLHDARTFPVTGRLVVFLHGLCETDACWSWAAEKRWGDPSATYGSKLADDDGWTPVYATFNSGLRISANARELSHLLEDLVTRWPTPVTEVALIGHSLGGLVARSTAHQAHEHDQRWVRSLRHVVGLGTPHLGAPLERLANRTMSLLARLPETRPIATLVNQRSVGIKDLRHGAIVEDDWFDHDPDDAADHCTPASLVPGVAYSMVSATLTRGTSGPFAMDLLVQHGSAHGIGTARSIPFEPDRAHHIGGKHHFDLLADPTVYDRLRHWLAGDDGAAAPAGH